MPKISNAETNVYLESNRDGRVFTSDGNGGDFQNWIYEISDGSVWFYLKNKATGLYLDSYSDGGAVYCSIFDNSNKETQKWRFEGPFIINKATNFALDWNRSRGVCTSAVSNISKTQNWIRN